MNQALKTLAINPNNAQAHYMIGKCYLRTVRQKSEAIGHFKKAKVLGENISDINYFLGEGYRYNNHFKEAISCYSHYRKSVFSLSQNCIHLLLC